MNTPLTGLPRFITFTGIDDAALVPGMQALSQRYPIEWGVLIDPEREGQPLFPAAADRAAIEAAGLRLAAHVCGAPAAQIASGADCALDLRAYARAQINHGFAGSSEEQIDRCARFGIKRRLRIALQCQGDFPEDARVDWLFDVSFGKGARPVAWPVAGHGLCGYSGGINPDNIGATLAALLTARRANFWIDMESGVRSGERFDLGKCEAVCRLVFG